VRYDLRGFSTRYGIAEENRRERRDGQLVCDGLCMRSGCEIVNTVRRLKLLVREWVSGLLNRRVLVFFTQ